LEPIRQTLEELLACSSFFREANPSLGFSNSTSIHRAAHPCWTTGSFSHFKLIATLERKKTEIETKAVVVSLRQNHLLMEQVRIFMDRAIVEPNAKLRCHLLLYPENQINCGYLSYCSWHCPALGTYRWVPCKNFLAFHPAMN
jgi:hypothetical protein